MTLVSCGNNAGRFRIEGRLRGINQGELYIDGQWATDIDKEHYRMRYNGEKKVYYTALLQKQGYYNYRFITADGQIPPSEGNFYQTENCYQVLVYYKEVGGRTWRLVGYKSLELR